MKKALLFLLLSLNISFAQNSINSYQYIIVQKQYEFQKSEDQHQLNSLAKFMFEKEGFITFFPSDQIPADLATNSCLALKAKIKSTSGLFTTKLSIDLLDCYNNVVFSSKEGKSKLKNYTKAYHDAFRKAFVSISNLNYTYNAEATITKNDLVKNSEIIAVKQKENKNEKTAQVISDKKNKKVSEKPLAVLKKEPKKDKLNKKVKLVKEKKLNVILRSIEGQFDFKQWGISKVVKDGFNYKVIGGSEGFEFAKIYKTSKPNIYIIKWVANKEPRLVEVHSDGNLSIDTANSKEVYKRID
jgi:hypothetical protein